VFGVFAYDSPDALSICGEVRNLFSLQPLEGPETSMAAEAMRVVVHVHRQCEFSTARTIYRKPLSNLSLVRFVGIMAIGARDLMIRIFPLARFHQVLYLLMMLPRGLTVRPDTRLI
jgi:hypothetical protein